MVLHKIREVPVSDAEINELAEAVKTAEIAERIFGPLAIIGVDNWIEFEKCFAVIGPKLWKMELFTRLVGALRILDWEFEPIRRLLNAAFLRLPHEPRDTFLEKAHAFGPFKQHLAGQLEKVIQEDLSWPVFVNQWLLDMVTREESHALLCYGFKEFGERVTLGAPVRFCRPRDQEEGAGRTNILRDRWSTAKKRLQRELSLENFGRVPIVRGRNE